MKIIRDDQLATFTFVPVEADEEQVLASIASLLKPEDKLQYGGCELDEDKRKRIVHLHAGSVEKGETETIGRVIVQRTVHAGGVKLVLRGSTAEDKEEIGCIRDTCFVGSDGLIFLGEVEVDGKVSVVVTAKRCQHCNAGMITYFNCEWNTCGTCAAKCEHTYIRGIIHGGGTDIGMGEFCDKCGCGKPKDPKERKKTQVEHHLAVEQETGVHIIYKEGPVTTPRQAVDLLRLSRRYAKSRRRSERQ